jgi:chromosome segregation ATPase
MTSPDAVPLGEYRGFPMELRFDSFNKEYVVQLKGQLSHTVSLGTDLHGNITRLDNVLDGMAEKLEVCKEQLATVEKRMETAKEEATVPFSREQELADKTARLAQLTIELKLEKNDHEILDEAPDEADAASQPQKKKDRGDTR